MLLRTRKMFEDIIDIAEQVHEEDSPRTVANVAVNAMANAILNLDKDIRVKAAVQALEAMAKAFTEITKGYSFMAISVDESIDPISKK